MTRADVIASAMRRNLELDDLARLGDAVATSGNPPPVFAAIEKLTAEVIGHRLFTIMQFDAETFEVARVHSSLPAVYPVGGRKQKGRTAWGDHTLVGMNVFRANDAEGIRAAFDDHATILGLGLGSILNIPICFDGRCTGTMNLCHQAGWFTPDDERTGRLIGSFLTPALLHMQAGGL
jgi:hypothetical protein